MLWASNKPRIVRSRYGPIRPACPCHEGGTTVSTTERPSPSERHETPPRGLRVWHLWLLSLFVAVAIVNIQDQRRSEPALIALATAGFVLYGLIGWAGWRLARRLER